MKYISLDQVCNIGMGQAPPGRSYNKSGEGIPLIAGAGDFGDTTPRTNKYTTAPTRISQPGDIILCIRATIGDTNWSDKQYCLGRGVAGLHPNPDLLDKNYLWHWLLSVKGLLVKSARGSTFKQVSRDEIRALPFPEISLPEQKRIAAILDKADAIRRKRQQAIKFADEFLRSVFLDMFRPFKAWTVSIGELLNKNILILHKDGNHGSLYPRTEDFGQNGIPFLSAKCLTNSGDIDGTLVQRLKEEKANLLKIGWIEKGDVLLAHNATVGPVYLYSGQYEKAIIGTSLTAFRPNPRMLVSEFLVTALRSNFFQNQLNKLMKQTTRNQVPITAQRNLKIQLFDFEKQIAFSLIFKTISGLVSKQLEQLELEESFFNSLAQRAFRGEL